MKIVFIGYGNLAKALVQGLTTEANTLNLELYASAPSLQRECLANGVKTSPDNLAFLAEADWLILAVKPKQMEAVLAEIASSLPKQCLVLSLAAGLELDFFSQRLAENQSIVRALPNLPVANRQGATALYTNSDLRAEQKMALERVFSHLGLYQWLSEESLVNAYTAISGSGPAYLFYFLEGFTKAATGLGINLEAARPLCLQTIAGAVGLLEQSGASPEALRQQVSSEAGTTAAAIQVLADRGLQEDIIQACKAAYERAIVLGMGS